MLIPILGLDTSHVISGNMEACRLHVRHASKASFIRWAQIIRRCIIPFYIHDIIQ